MGTGAGLGLAIVSGIAAAHGGTASAANASDGDGGAIFTIRLPLDAPAPDTRHPAFAPGGSSPVR